MKKFLLLVVCLLGLSIVLLINAAIAYDITEVRKDAEGGVAAAQALLGYLYYTGDSVEQDYQQAAEWYRKAAKQGNSHAQAFLGSMYLLGEGVEKDYLQAAAWLRKAAEQGNVFAQCRLGTMYYIGDGVGQDYFQAATWLRKAAEQGDSDAQGLLGILYYGGEGVEQDTQQAIAWLKKSAEQGNTNALEILNKLEVDIETVYQNAATTQLEKLVAEEKIPLYVRDKGTFSYDPQLEMVQILKDGVNLRSQPNPQANVIGKANREMWGSIEYLGEWTHPKGDKWIVGLYDDWGNYPQPTPDKSKKIVWILNNSAKPINHEDYVAWRDSIDMEKAKATAQAQKKKATQKKVAAQQRQSGQKKTAKSNSKSPYGKSRVPLNMFQPGLVWQCQKCGMYYNQSVGEGFAALLGGSRRPPSSRCAVGGYCIWIQIRR